jgi:RNA polymerase sigma factor (TIGR02999 family)
MSGPSVTELLARTREGDADALAELLPLVYDELRRVARDQMRRERPGATLQATALVHEAWLRLSASRGLAPRDRSHFVALAARVMRRVLIERARARHAQKRGGPAVRVPIDDLPLAAPSPDADLLALDGALDELTRLDPQQARLVELRFFGGLDVDETAAALGLSPATVKRRWASARAFLARALMEP